MSNFNIFSDKCGFNIIFTWKLYIKLSSLIWSNYIISVYFVNQSIFEIFLKQNSEKYLKQ